ncbi:hypothetical protein ACWD3Z_43245 [Streptomyces sp. NPDC002740]
MGEVRSAVLADAPADERPPPRGQAVAEEARPATEDDREYAAYERLADRLAAAAMTGPVPGRPGAVQDSVLTL